MRGPLATTVSPPTRTPPSWDHIRNLTLIGKGVIQGIKWTGTSTYHALPLIGTKVDGKKVYIVDIGLNTVEAKWTTYANLVAGNARLDSTFAPTNGWTNN